MMASFTPVTAFHRATQKPFASTKRGCWGALHVGIAWKIHHHKQLKKMEQKPNSLHPVWPLESPAIGRPDSVQHTETVQPLCILTNLDSPHGKPGKTAETLSHRNEKLEGKQQGHMRHKTDEKKDLPVREGTSRDGTVTSDLDGRPLDKKGLIECNSVIKVKRLKKETVCEPSESSKYFHADPSPFRTTHVHRSSNTTLVLYPYYSSRSNVTRASGGRISYPVAENHPYQTPSWEPMWDVHKKLDLHFRQTSLKEHSLNTCNAIRTHLVAQRQKEAFHGLSTPTIYVPLSIMQQQDTACLRRMEYQHLTQQNTHIPPCQLPLPQPGFLAPSYLGP